MTITDFIEKAIAGGFTKYSEADAQEYFGEFLLNPEAWKAFVGDGIPEQHNEAETRLQNGWPQYVYLMHGLIDALVEGRTVEQYLETL
jgi:hypothetical protein